ncbi:MAG: alpha/beta hydrolase [Anaerolineae bacterium]
MAESIRSVANVNGTSLSYEIAGQGALVVLLHGDISDQRMWDDQFGALSEHYRVLRYDFRGFGKSARLDKPYSDLSDLNALLDFLEIKDRVHLIGSSMGANVAISFALEHPDRVASLILVSPGLGGFSDYGQALINVATDIDRMAKSGDLITAVELSIRLWIDGLTRPASAVDPSVRLKLHRILSENAHMLAAPDDLDTPLDPPPAARLGEITAPTLLLVGDRDLREINAIADAILEGIPTNVEKIVLPDVAHMLNVEKPTEFNQVVLNYLGNQMAGDRPHPPTPFPASG